MERRPSTNRCASDDPSYLPSRVMKREAEEIAERKELQRLHEIEKVRIVLSMMKPAQERRLYKFVIEGKSCREIAVEEGTYHSSVSKSIEAAKKSFKKIYENL